MQRTLYYIPHEFISLGDLGFGWLLIGWIGFSLVLLAFLIWRQGWNRDTASYVPLLVVFGCVIWWLLPRVEVVTRGGQPVGLPIRGYGIMVMLGVIAAVALAAYRAQRMGLSAETILSLAMWVFVPGIIGARLVFVVQYWSLVVVPGSEDNIDWPQTVANMVSFQEGGLVVYGAFIGGFIGGIAHVTRKRLPVLALADLVAPSVMVGLAIGRIGCLLNGCCYGGLCESTSPFASLAITFPRAAAPELEEDRPPESHENSPPYARHRELGLLHGIHVVPDDQSRPVIADVDTAPGGAAAPDQLPSLPKNDPIATINGTPVHEHQIRGQTVTPVEHAYRLLGQAGLDVNIETQNGQSASWSIEQLPERSLPVHPTQIYSAISASLAALLLWTAYPFGRRDGQTFALLLTLYPVTRWLLEMIRADEGGQFGTEITLSQWVSALILCTAIGLWIYIWRRPSGRVLFPHPA